MSQQYYEPQYAPQAPQQFTQPVYAPQGPPQQYAAPAYPQQGPPPGYPPQQQYAAPPAAPPLATGSLDEYYAQPSSGGGPSLKFEQPGTRYVGIVARPITQADVQQQTDTNQRPLFFRDGRPKFVMKVPLQMQPSAQYPDGTAQLWVKTGMRDELNRAMAEAGAPEGPPEAGAFIDITFTNTRSAGAGNNPAKVYSIRYTRPGGQPGEQPATASTGAPSPAPVQQQPVAQQAVPQAPAQQYAAPAPQGQPQQYAQQPAPQGQVAQPQGQPQYGQAPQQQAPVQQVPQQPQAPRAPQGQPQGAQQLPPNLDPSQQQLLAQLTGQQA